MRRLRRVTAAALCALLVSGTVVMLAPSPAEAQKVGNPGSGFILKVQQGLLRIKDQAFDFDDETRQPQCSDGQNNDDSQDTAVDFPADDDCSSATDDSEVAGGFQAKQPIQLTGGTINANGTYSFSGVSFPRQYMWVADAPVVGSFQVNIDIVGLGPATGTINPATGAMTLSMSVEVRASGGQLNSGCKVGPINVNGMTTGTTAPPGPNTPITGVPYNPATGRVTLVQNSYSVPGASGCTATFLNVSVNDEINSQLGLPSDPGNNEATFLGEFVQGGADPQAGVVATFTTTPSSGLAPLNVAFNAAGSSGAPLLTYQWDFTNNGSFDATGATTNFTYTSGGAHTARLRVTDGDGDFAETTRVINVGANLPPTATDKTVNVPEDAVDFPITLQGTDPENGTLTYSRVAPNPANGTVSCTGSACTYTPDPNYNGPDSFGFRVTDNLPNFDNGLVTINVTPVNDVPVASNVSATVLEDGSVSVNLVGNDVDGTPLTYDIVSAPTKGTLSSGTGSARTYTPNANEHGTDTFTYTVSDGTATSNVATGTITITSVNDAPTANDQSVTVAEDAPPTAVTLSGSDVEPGALTYSIVATPTNGTLGGSLPNLTYKPAPNYNGPDSIVFKVTDGDGASDTATVTIDVTPVNDVPTTGNLSVSTNEEVPVTVTIPGADLDGDTLTYTPSTPTAGGNDVSCTANQCTFTPAVGFAGSDSFTVTVSDGTASVTSTVSVNVIDLSNTAPTINDATVVGLEDATRTFNLVSADVDGDPRTHTVQTQPTNGTLTCTAAGACTFVPTANANGSSTASVLVEDGRGGIDTAVITLIVVPVNDAPTIPSQSLTTAEDTAGTVELAATDVDGDALAWTLKIGPTKGSVTCTGAGACTFTPNANANGSDSFVVEANDGHGARVTATIPVTITPVNDPPTAGTVNVAVVEDGNTSFTLTGTDLDGNAVTFTADPAATGTLSCTSAGACTFTSAANATGTQTVAYSVSDGTAATGGAIVITITPVNDAPVAVSQTLTTAEDVPLSFTLAANDPDVGDVHSFQVRSAPAQGALGGTAPNLTYVPAPNASGTVSLTYEVTDAAGASSTATITILVTPADDLPVPGNPSITTAEDTAKAVALTGSDAEGPVTVAVVTAPAHGTYAGGIYTPTANYNGPDSITYKVTSNTGQVVNGTVSITVVPVNDPPVALDATISTTRTVPKAFTLGATDVDGTAGLVYEVVSAPTKGTLSGTAPNLTYTPTGLSSGADTLTFKVTDSSGASDTGTVGITIAAGGALPTTLTAGPATVVRPTGLLKTLGKNTYTNLNATFTTSGGVPVPGVTITFKVGTGTICSATTNASGVATCNGQGAYSAATTYTASFAGNAAFVAASSEGTLS